MAQATKVLIADGDVLSSTPNNEGIYFASNASGIPVVPGSHHILPTNPYTLVFDDAGKPSGYDRKNNRHTVAMDVKFVEDFLEIESCHTGIISRHKGWNSVPYVRGDNRGAAAIAGKWGYAGGSVALEEIEITNDFNNGESHHPPSAQHPRGAIGQAKLQGDRWYRMVLESIVFHGAVGHKVRFIDKQTKSIVYKLPIYWSEFSGNYVSRDDGKVCVFSIHDPAKPAAGFYFTNLMSYWTRAHKSVAHP